MIYNLMTFIIFYDRHSFFLSYKNYEDENRLDINILDI